jgi:hypothetical protein
LSVLRSKDRRPASSLPPLRSAAVVDAPSTNQDVAECVAAGAADAPGKANAAVSSSGGTGSLAADRATHGPKSRPTEQAQASTLSVTSIPV